MKPTTSSRILLLTTLLVMILAPMGAALGASLSLEATSDGATVASSYQQGTSLYLNIRVDDPADIAGAAFTLTFDAATVTPPAIGADGLPANSGDISSIFPFTYQATDTFRAGTTTGKIYLSGAAIDSATGGALYETGSDLVLFTVKFTVKTDATIGSDFVFGLEQTRLFNPAAGYGVDANSNGIFDAGSDTMDPVPVLVGALPNTSSDFNDLTKAFPVLLGNDAKPFTTIASATLTVGIPSSISGTVTYGGSQTGTLRVAAYASPGGTTPLGIQEIAWADGNTSAAFTVSGIFNGTYTLAAYIDSNANGIRDPAEAIGAYTSPVITIAGGPDSVARDFALVDPDNDSDGMPDYWEAQYGLSDPDLDADGDGYSNYQEFLNGTDPKVDDPPGGTGYDHATDDGVAATALALAPADDMAVTVGDTQLFTAGGGYAAFGGNVWTIEDSTPVSAGNAVGSVAASGNNAQALFTALAPGSVRVRVTDIRTADATSGLITVVPPITITASPAFDSMNANGVANFTASGGTGQYVWTASAGTITGTGIFTAPTVTNGSQAVTITVYDAVFNSTHATPVKGTYTLTVYPAVALATHWAGYTQGQPMTYPLLSFGQKTTLAAADTARYYDWSVKDWTGTYITGETTGTVTYTVDPDALFTARGAGVYMVTMTDHDRAHLTASYYVRVGMKLAHNQSSNNLKDDIGVPVVFTVETHGSSPITANVFNWTANGLTGVAVTPDTAGTLAVTTTTDNTNDFSITRGIPAPVSFRITASLDPGQAAIYTDVARLIDAGLGSVTSRILRISPMVKFTGKVVEADGLTAVDGSVLAVAKVTALNDPTVTAAIAADGTFTLGPLADVGIPYRFIVSATGYVDKIISSAGLVKTPSGSAAPLSVGSSAAVALQSAAGGSAITGDVNLDDVVGGNAPKTFIKVKADGAYITDDTGTVITVMTAADGGFRFPVPAAFTTAISYTVEVAKRGYITASASVLNPPPGLNITLYPVTIITASCTAGADVTADGISDSVVCTISANAGSVPERFNGTAAEVGAVMAGGAVVSLSYDGAANAWTFTHPAYENFRFTVSADVSETLRDVTVGYRATRVVEYVKSGRTYGTVSISDPNLSGSTAPAGSVNTQVNLPPGGLGGELLDGVSIAIVEANAGSAGAQGITGSNIADITMFDDNGSVVDNAMLQRLEITISFDPAVVPEGALEAGTYLIYQAASMTEMVSGSYTAVDPGRIIPPVDYANGVVTFWVDHLSAFGIGASVTSGSSGVGAGAAAGGGGGGGCFIDTAGGRIDGAAMTGARAIVLMAALMLACAAIRRRHP